MLRDAFADSLRDSGTDAAIIAVIADQLLAAYMGLQVLAKAGCPLEQLRPSPTACVCCWPAPAEHPRRPTRLR